MMNLGNEKRHLAIAKAPNKLAIKVYHLNDSFVKEELYE